MSRPPKPVRVLNQAMGGTSLPAGLQEIRRVVLEDGDEQRARKPHDVQVVALNPLYETTPEPLDRVGAGATFPLAALEIRVDRLGREQSKRHVRQLVPDDVLVRAE